MPETVEYSEDEFETVDYLESGGIRIHLSEDESEDTDSTEA
jgi:hypothetical protein